MRQTLTHSQLKSNNLRRLHCRWTSFSILLLILGSSVLSGCAQCGPCAAGTSRVCTAPRWYWSNGKYWRPVDDFVTWRAARACAHKSYCRRCQKGCPTADDYRDGYEQAFIDLAFGGNGVTPAVPPQKYWKANNRSPQGYDRVAQWYAGYEAGVCDANAFGRQNYLYVPTAAGGTCHINDATEYDY